MLFVVLYALCVITPSAAVAFGDGSRTAHCLTDDNSSLAHVHGNNKPHLHEGAIAHSHADEGLVHDHADDSDEPQSSSGQCCGLFCVSAIAPSFDLPLLRFERPALLPSLNAYGIPESGPERLYRPPDVLLSL
ncbi:MAG: hypothetical protein AB1490_00665 [Pseudomonadota bacterium]